MARVFITGSVDGLGQLAAQQIVNEGHQVVLNACNEKILFIYNLKFKALIDIII